MFVLHACMQTCMQYMHAGTHLYAHRPTSIGLTQQPPRAPHVSPAARRSDGPGGAAESTKPMDALVACTASVIGSSRPIRTALKHTSPDHKEHRSARKWPGWIGRDPRGRVGCSAAIYEQSPARARAGGLEHHQLASSAPRSQATPCRNVACPVLRARCPTAAALWSVRAGG